MTATSLTASTPADSQAIVTPLAHTTRRRLLRTFGPPLLFLLLSAGFLWQPLLTGHVFLPTDLAFRYDYMWVAQANTPGLSVSQNSLLSDVSDYYYPYANFAIGQLKAGHFPLWNPYILSGQPLHASTQAALLDPINLLTYLAGPLAYWTWAAWLRLALLGWTTYGFLRALGRTAAGGMAAGVIFMLCAFVTAWLNYSVVWSLVWFPGLCWASTRLLQTRRTVWLAMTALMIGGLLCGGHPETQFLCGLFWSLYILHSVLLTPRAAWIGHLARLAGGVALGLALSVVQWGPFVDLLFHSSALVDRGNWVIPPFNMGQTLVRLGVALLPNLSGSPLDRNYWVPGFTNFNEQASGIGLLSLALAALGVVRLRRVDRRVVFFAAAGLLALLIAIRAPGFHLIKSLPVFNVGHGVRWAIVWSFCGAVLAGYGLDALLGLQTHKRAQWRVAAAWGGAALLGTALLLTIYLGASTVLWTQMKGLRLPPNAILDAFNPLAGATYWPLAFLAAGAGVVALGAAGRLRPALSGTLLILLLYMDLWTFGSRYNPVTPAWSIYPPTPTLQTLWAGIGHDRFMGMTNLLRPNTPMLLGLRDIRGYEDVIDNTYARLYNPLFAKLDLANHPDTEFSATDDRLMSIAAVRYVLTARKLRVPGNQANYPIQEERDGVAIYANKGALPRAYVVYSSVAAAEGAAAHSALLDPALDPHRTVVLTDGPVLSSPALDVSATPVTWLRDDPQDVAVSATLPAPGVLVLSDVYTRDWEATVDGQPAPIWRANAAFRGVVVPAGAHTVQFTYRPRLFYNTAAISLAAAGVILLLAVAHLWGAWRSTRRVRVVRA